MDRYSEAQAKENLQFALLQYRMGKLTGEEKTLQEYLEDANITVSDIEDGIYTVVIGGYEFKLNEDTLEIEGEVSKVEQESPEEPDEQETPEETKEYKLTLIAGNYIEEVSGAGTYKEGESVTINATLLENETGYTNKWVNWTSSDTSLIANNSTQNATITMPAGDVTLTANGTRTINTYTVTYNANGGDGAPANQTKTYGEDLALSSTEPTRMNYVFLGWSKSNSSNTVEYNAGDTYTENENVTLYAVWGDLPTTLKYSGGSNPTNVTTSTDKQQLTYKGTGGGSIEIPAGGYTITASVSGAVVKFTGNSGTETTIISASSGSESYEITEPGIISFSGQGSIKIIVTATGESVTFELDEE